MFDITEPDPLGTAGAHRVHVDEPARPLPGLLHPVEAEASVHVVGELAALQPLDGRHRGAVIPDSHHGSISFF